MNKPYVRFYVLPFTEILLLHNIPFVHGSAASSPTPPSESPIHNFTSVGNQHLCPRSQLGHLLSGGAEGGEGGGGRITSLPNILQGKRFKGFSILKNQPKGVGCRGGRGGYLSFPAQ